MEKPICYIPDNLEGYYKKTIDNPFKDKITAIKTILSIYLDYQCLPTEHNEQEPHDPNGLGILEMLCLKLIMFPEHTRHIRDFYSKLPDFYQQVLDKKKNIIQIIDEHFTIEELESYGI
jgi:hypothetical protein